MNNDLANLEPGRALDARVCEMLGFEPRISWEVLSPDNASAYTAERRADAEKWLRDHLAQYPNSWVKGYRVGTWKHYPLVSRKMDAAMLLQEAMDTRGYWMQLRSSFGASDTPAADGWWCGFTPHLTTGSNGRPDHYVQADTAPLAICRAAILTLSDAEACRE